MAQRVQVVLIDDVDGGAADETISFGLDRVSYEIDLSEANAEKLREALTEWTKHARRAGGRRSAGRRPVAVGRRQDHDAIRTWGRANGYKVSDRGRISGELQDAYDKANG